MPSLEDFHRLHSMVSHPKNAQSCINEFRSVNGCILFMPSSYISAEQNQIQMAKCDASLSLNLFSYYFLVLLSLTGLSTLLGMTDTIQMAEYSQQEQKEKNLCVWPLEKRNCDDQLLMRSSIKEPSIKLGNSVFQYLENHTIQSTKGKEVALTDSKEGRPTFHLKRKYEYHFRLINTHVIMVHFSCTHQGQTSLHLVEVYHMKDSIFKVFFLRVWVALGEIKNFFFARLKEE